jgi:autotransporter-associated beta strand protein
MKASREVETGEPDDSMTQHRPSNPGYSAATAGRLPVEQAWLYRPTTDWTYSHHAHLVFFKGLFFAVWSNGRQDEDAPGQRVLLSTSTDFRAWTPPVPLLDSQPGKHSERVRSRDNHGFTGTLKVRGVYWGYLGIGTVSNVMGAVTGPVELYGNDLGNDKLKLIIESGTGSVEARKGDLTFFGSPVVRLDASATAGRTGTVVFASLIRTNRSTLGIYDDQSQLGGRELVKITAAPASTNGMVAPCFWNLRAGTFLDYGANGFVANGWDTNALGSTTPTNKVNLTGGGTVPVGGAEVYALRAGGALLGPDVLTNHSGGLILYNNTVNHTAPLAFGTNEAIVHVISGNTHSFLAPVSGTNGFTKSGYGTLSLLGTNAALYGDITLSDGRLSINNNAGLGSTNNTIVLNGGLLHVNVGATITNNIYLAAGLSGYLGSGSGTVIFRGKISGPGALQCNYWPFGGGEGGYQVSNPLNDYTGGTYVYNAFLTVTSTGKLGNGPVYIGSSSGGTANNPAGGVSSLGDDNFSTNHTLTQGSFSAGLWFSSANPKVGSFEGLGMIVLYAANARLTTGYDNRDTDYFGQIMEDPINRLTKLVKMGTGRFTLWGENTYSGGTEVSNGTLVVNNWINPVGPVVVRPGATLDGLGTVGVVSNLGGTVTGSLFMRQLVMNAAATNAVTLNGSEATAQYGQLNVSESVTLAGTLKVTLGFAPAIGQTFTILNNTSAALLSTQFACGDSITAVYNGRTYFFRVSYNGGDGNDVVLTRLVTGSVMTIR